MNPINADLSAGIDRLESALQALDKEKTSQNRELVCVETRAVFAVFEDESFWLGKVEPDILAKLQVLYTNAAQLMASERDSLYDAVERRRQDLATRDFTKIPAEMQIPAL